MTMHTILNVDDTPANRYLKTRALRRAGYEVLEAATGEAAFAAIDRHRPDLVLLDIRLPDMSGLDVCRRIKGDPRTSAIPVVHISATFVDDGTKASSLDVGADVYLAEPVAPHELASAIRTVLRLSAAERAAAENHERMRLAARGAGIATWDIGLGADATASWSPEFLAMLGYPPERAPAPTLETWLNRVRFDERTSVAKAFSEAAERSRSISIEHWIERADNGEHRCIAALGTRQDGPDGRPLRLIGVATDVTERKREEEDRERLLNRAREAQRQAEEASRMKDEFLAMLSHELRTPLTAVLGWLKLARTGRLDDAQRDKALETVERNARLQAQLIEDLLDVSRIVTGKLEREGGTAYLDEVVESAIDSARAGASPRSISIRADIAPGRWPVLGNSARLTQIFNNLLSNAVKFSPDGAAVDVRLERAPGGVRVTIADEGEGLAPEVVPVVFDTFRQADSSIRRKHGGLGLGLAIVKSLVELHGGSVAAQSAGLGRGAAFAVTLPAAGAAEPDASVTPDTGADDRAASSPGRIAGEHVADLRILVVDDDPDNRMLTAQILRLEGADVEVASTAAEAVDRFLQMKPDVLILDIGMPEVDGYSLLGRLRSQPGAGAALPALALTGYASATDARAALEAGFQAHLAKPYDVADLLRTLARITANLGR